MPFDIDNKLVVAVASSALFDLGEADQVFREHGEDAYRAYQREHEDDILKPGVAFAFVQRLLSFNESPDDAPVEVILLSRNDPDTGLRVFNSIEAHGLDITRAAFLTGDTPYRYIKAYNASIFLSANEQDVRDAIMANYPAGLVLDSAITNDQSDMELRVAFDFDGVIADGSAEEVFKRNGMDAFHRSETERSNQPHDEGPLKELFYKLAQLQDLERQRAQKSGKRVSRLKVAIITARNAPSHKRVVTSLRNWGITVDNTFFLGGMEKSRILEEFRPHIFFDDQRIHLDPATSVVPCVHVPLDNPAAAQKPRE